MSDILIHNVGQGSKEWLALRLGRFTSSRIGDLMTSSRKKGEIFGKTALSYIYEIAAERNIAEWVKAGNLDLWFERTQISAYALQYGIDNEDFARNEYSRMFDVAVEEVGFITRKDIPFFGDSPDGVVREGGVLEIKCPKNSSIHLQYSLMQNAEDLKVMNSNYYWQCYSHLLATGAKWCDFVSYDMYQENSIHRIRIYPDEFVFNQIRERISLANDEVESILKKVNSKELQEV